MGTLLQKNYGVTLIRNTQSKLALGFGCGAVYCTLNCKSITLTLLTPQYFIAGDLPFYQMNWNGITICFNKKGIKDPFVLKSFSPPLSEDLCKFQQVERKSQYPCICTLGPKIKVYTTQPKCIWIVLYEWVIIFNWPSYMNKVYVTMNIDPNLLSIDACLIIQSIV